MSIDGCMRALAEALEPWPAPPADSTPFWMGGTRDWDDDYCHKCGDWIEPGTASTCKACR